MPRPKGAANILRPITVNGEQWYFPNIYVAALEKRNVRPEQVARIQGMWVDIMKSANFTPDIIHQQRNDIVKIAMPAFEKAMKVVLGAPGTNPTALPQQPTAQAVASSASNGPVATATPAGPSKFLTDPTKFYGIDIQDPPHQDTPDLGYEYLTEDSEWDEIYTLIASKQPVLLEGEMGTGKTDGVLHMAQKLGLPVSRMGHNIHTDVEDVLGRRKLIAGPGGATLDVFEDGPLTQRYEHGGFYIADEFNAAKPQTNMLYQEINEGKGTITLTNDNGRVIKRHPLFFWVGTQNPGTYAGTQVLNPAQLDRPIIFKVDYASEVKEKKILRSRFPLMSMSDISKLVRFANETRARKSKDPETVQYVCSTRSLVAICKLLSEYEGKFSMRRAVDLKVLNMVHSLGDLAEYEAIKTLVEASFSGNP